MKSDFRTKLRGSVSILPSAVLLLLLAIVPLCTLIMFSFINGNIISGNPVTYTLDNYKQIFSTSIFSTLMLKSIRMGLEVTFFCILIGWPAAWALAKVVRPNFRNIGVMLVIIPFFTSQLLLIYSIMVLFESKGVVMSLLGFLHLADPAKSVVYNNACVVMILVYEFLPYMILSLYSTLEQIDDSVVAASHSLGAGKFKTFVHVVFPLSMSGLLSGIILVFVPAVGSFVEPNIAGGPNGMMVGSLIDSDFSVSLNMGHGAALSLLFLIIIAAITYVVDLCMKKANKAVGGAS